MRVEKKDEWRSKKKKIKRLKDVYIRAERKMKIRSDSRCRWE